MPPPLPLDRKTTPVLAALIGAVFCAGALAADARPSESVLSAIPSQAILVIHGTPPRQSTQPGTQPAAPGSAEAIETLAGLLNVAGLVSGQGQLFADLAGWLPLFARHEFVVALIDATASATASASDAGPATQSAPAGDPDSQPSIRLDQLQLGIVIRTGGKNTDVAAALNRLVSKYTNNELARLSAVRAGRFEGQALRDSRLPGWAVWEWCEMDDFFVIALGAGCLERVADSVEAPRKSLAGDDWYKRAHAACGGSAAWFEVYLNHHQAETRLPEELLKRVRAVRAALDSDAVERDLWALRTAGRIWSIDRFERSDGQDRVHRYGRDDAEAAPYRSLIPPGARHFAVLDAPIRTLVEAIPRAVLAAQSERGAAAMRRWWKRTEADLGVDIDGEIVNRLGNEVLLFDYPPHPLGIPLALTIAVPIRDATQVRRALGAAFDAWERRLSRHGNSPLFRASVQKTDDGLWYIQAGIVGPAAAVTDRFIVISWSPQALREALTFLAGTTSGSAPPP